MGKAGFDAVERAVEDDGGDGAPVGERHGLERLFRAHRRIVDENVDAAKREAASSTMLRDPSASATSAVTASALPPARSISPATAFASCTFSAR
jgi:hypothetical protein